MPANETCGQILVISLPTRLPTSFVPQKSWLLPSWMVWFLRLGLIPLLIPGMNIIMSGINRRLLENLGFLNSCKTPAIERDTHVPLSKKIGEEHLNECKFSDQPMKLCYMAPRRLGLLMLWVFFVCLFVCEKWKAMSWHPPTCHFTKAKGSDTI